MCTTLWPLHICLDIIASEYLVACNQGELYPVHWPVFKFSLLYSQVYCSSLMYQLNGVQVMHTPPPHVYPYVHSLLQGLGR